MGMRDIMSIPNCKIDKIIDTTLKKERDKEIAHSRIIDGMTYDQILAKYFSQYDSYSEKTKERLIRIEIIPIIDRVLKSAEEGD